MLESYSSGSKFWVYQLLALWPGASFFDNFLFTTYLLSTNYVPGTLCAGYIAVNKAKPIFHEAHMLEGDIDSENVNVSDRNKQQGEK